MNTEPGTAETGGKESGPPPLSRKQRRQMGRQAANARPRGKCPFPGCGKIFYIDEGKPGACPRHRELIADVVFIMNRTSGKSDAQEEAEGSATDQGPALFIPKPGMSNQAIKEAAEAAKGQG